MMWFSPSMVWVIRYSPLGRTTLPTLIGSSKFTNWVFATPNLLGPAESITATPRTHTTTKATVLTERIRVLPFHDSQFPIRNAKISLAGERRAARCVGSHGFVTDYQGQASWV